MRDADFQAYAASVHEQSRIARDVQERPHERELALAGAESRGNQGTWKDGIWFSNQSYLPRPTFPFGDLCGIWFCEYCGKVLEAPDEFAEGVRRGRLEYFEPGTREYVGWATRDWFTEGLLDPESGIRM